MRLLLALLSAGVCAALGITAANRLRERERLLQSWKRALETMALSAAHRPAGIPELLRRGAGEQLPLLFRAAALLEREPALSPDAFWARLPPDPLLTRQETEALQEGFRGLFSPDAQLQLQALSCAREQLTRFHALSRETAEKNSRLYTSLGFLSGAALFILIC